MSMLLRITDDTTPEELREAITRLREKQRLCGMAEERARIGRAIDSLLDRLGECGG